MSDVGESVGSGEAERATRQPGLAPDDMPSFESAMQEDSSTIMILLILELRNRLIVADDERATLERSDSPRSESMTTMSPILTVPRREDSSASGCSSRAPSR